MAKPGSIVVGTDGSDRAERAVRRGGEIANALGVTVHVVSCFHEDEEQRTRAQHYVDRAQQLLASLGVASETHVWPGEPGEALVRIADEQDAQMIVVGNRGMTGARRVLGSVPNHVSHHARCAVLIVPTS
jgi:nucleotide-binding universal stress UspA family protein